MSPIGSALIFRKALPGARVGETFFKKNNLHSLCKFLISVFLITFTMLQGCDRAYWEKLFVNRELEHATFLSHGQQPEVNMLQARTLVSPRFSN